MLGIVQGFKEGVLSAFGLNTIRRRSLNTGLPINYGVESQKQTVSKTAVPVSIAAFFAQIIDSTSQQHMEDQMLTTELNLSGESDSHLEQSKTTSQAASLAGSDSEEESGYMSCASSEQKAGYARDTENLFTDIRSHSDSSKSDGSLNDLSSCDQNESHDQDQDDDAEECQTVLDSVHPDLKSSSGMLLETQQLEEQHEQDENAEQEDLNDEESSDEEETDEEREEEDEDDNENDDEQVKTLDKDEQEEIEESIEEEEEEEEEDEEESIKKPIQNRNYTRQTTVVERQETDDDSSDDEDFVLFPDSQTTKTAPKRLTSSESEGTWVSEEEDKTKVVNVSDNASDGPDIGDFFDGIADDVTYTFLEGDEDKVYTYPSKDFVYDRSSPVYGPAINDDDDDDDDFAYLYSSDLSTGKRYAFPRREPRNISDAVDFWETDFEVKGAIYPCMASWETKGLAPTYEEDPEDFDKFNMYKSLYEKWVKCNRSSEQWSQRYWGRSIEHVARMKGPGKRPMVTSQSDSAIYVSGTCLPSSGLVVNHSVADRRRRRRNDAVSAARGTSMCY